MEFVAEEVRVNPSAEIVVELLGILGSMADQRFNFNEFFNQFKLFDFLGRILADPDADPDILVEVGGGGSRYSDR